MTVEYPEGEVYSEFTKCPVIPGVLRISDNWDYLRSAGRSPSREPTRDAIELAGRIVRDRVRLSLAGIDAIREASLLMSHSGVTYETATRLLAITPPADDSAPPAPHMGKRATIAAELIAAGHDRAATLRSLTSDGVELSLLCVELAEHRTPAPLEPATPLRLAAAPRPMSLGRCAALGHTALSMRILRDQPGLTLKGAQDQASRVLRGEVPFYGRGAL